MNAQHSESFGDLWKAAVGQGDFDTAWRLSDEAITARSGTTRDDPRLPYHLRWVWDGRPFEDRRVLVRCYHGLGDTLQFCRFLAPLRRRTAHLTLEVQPELTQLLMTLDGPDLLIPFCRDRPSEMSECDLEIMELSHALRLMPPLAPYLHAPVRRAGSRFRVGLCWRASPTWSPERSVPTSVFAPILAGDDVEFVSLQLGGPALPGLANDCPAEITDTASRIAGLDLVVSVDTMVAHLAGALGVPLWLLLKADPDWRWLGGASDGRWYRDVRKYQQPRTGDWETPVKSIVSDLRQAVATQTLPLLSGL